MNKCLDQEENFTLTQFKTTNSANNFKEDNFNCRTHTRKPK